MAPFADLDHISTIFQIYIRIRNKMSRILSILAFWKCERVNVLLRDEMLLALVSAFLRRNLGRSRFISESF